MAKSSISSYHPEESYYYGAPAAEEGVIRRGGAIRPRTETGEEFYPETYEDLYKQYPQYMEYINSLRNRFYSPRLIYRFILRGVADKMRSSSATPAEQDLGAAIADVTPTMLPSGGTAVSSRPGGYFTGEEAMGFLREKEEQDKQLQEEFIRQAQLVARGASARITPTVVPPKTKEEPALEAGAEAGAEATASSNEVDSLSVQLTQTQETTVKQNNAQIKRLEEKLKSDYEDLKVLSSIANRQTTGVEIPRKFRNLSPAEADKKYKSLAEEVRRSENNVRAALKSNSEQYSSVKKAAEAKLKARAEREKVDGGSARVQDILTRIEQMRNDPANAEAIVEAQKILYSKQYEKLPVDELFRMVEDRMNLSAQKTAQKSAELEAREKEADEAQRQSDEKKTVESIKKTIDSIERVLAGYRAQLATVGVTFNTENYEVGAPIVPPDADDNVKSLVNSYINRLGQLQREYGKLRSPAGGSQEVNEVVRYVNGRPAVFNADTKQFIRWE